MGSRGKSWSTQTPWRLMRSRISCSTTLGSSKRETFRSASITPSAVSPREAAFHSARSLRRACFEQVRTVEDFDFAFNPSIPRAKVLELANVGFVARRENVLLVGNAGVGKSHLAQAFGHRACRAGYSVLYVGANEMFRQLRASRADDTYDRKLARLTAPDLLVIDDLGLRLLADHEPDDLFEIIRLRYERGAIVITSNRDEREIARLFGDPLLASAAMDRLLHHAHVLDLEGESYRNPPPERRRQRVRASQEAAQ